MNLKGLEKKESLWVPLGFVVFFAVSFFSLYSLAQSLKTGGLLDVLDEPEKESQTSNSTANSRLTHRSFSFKNFLKPSNSREGLFLSCLEKGHFQQALKHWFEAFGGKPFAKTHSGQALYAFLLFQNGLELSGLENLLKTHPKKVHLSLLEQWQRIMVSKSELWASVVSFWNEDWTPVFGLQAKIAVVSRSLSSQLHSPKWDSKKQAVKKLQELLALTSLDTWEGQWVQWQYIHALISEGEDRKAAQFLKHLQKSSQQRALGKKKNFISPPLLNLTAARLLYQNGYLKAAMGYYNKVPKTSDYWWQAQEEMAWCRLRLGQTGLALAQSHTLLQDIFTPDVGPSVFHLTALAQLKVCDYVGLAKTLEKFKHRFRSRAQNLKKLEAGNHPQAVQRALGVLGKDNSKVTDLGPWSVHLPWGLVRDPILTHWVIRYQKLQKEVQRRQEIRTQLFGSKESPPPSSLPTLGKVDSGKSSMAENSFTKDLEERVKKIHSLIFHRIQRGAREELGEISQVLESLHIASVEMMQQLLARDISGFSSPKKKLKFVGSEKDPNLTLVPSWQKAQIKSPESMSYQLSFPVKNNELWFDEISNYSMDFTQACGGKVL